jgi:glycine/D-amino acid oxidase-like deaminating enzyme
LLTVSFLSIDVMKTYDWIVVGGGITGAALSYELVQQGFSVLLLEKNAPLQGATRYSYGGLAYWSGTSDLTRRLCEEGRARHQTLSAELEADTQFRELDLLLTVATEENPEKIAADYAKFAISPQLLSVEEACKLEPLLNPAAISGALSVRHGHIHPDKTNQAYLKAMQRDGGEPQIAQVVELVRAGDRLLGVKTSEQTYHAANTVICAGGLSRRLLQEAGIKFSIYFTHAEMIETPPVDLQLQTMVMPATTKRFALEAKASTEAVEPLWNEPGNEPAPPILDVGAIQFLDGSLRIGQWSRVLTDPEAQVDAVASEAAIRSHIGKVLPALEALPGIWHDCLVAFSSNNLPVVGALNGVQGAYSFSGFTNPLVFVPPLAKHFASWVAGQENEVINQLR